MMNYLRPERPVQASQPSGLGRWVFATYVAALVYASLFPITGWRQVDDSVFSFLWQPWPRHWSGFDVISNFIAYVPLGLMASLHASKTQTPRSGIVTACIYGFALSFGLEVLQNFLPTRVPSWPDILFNTLGSLAGGLLGAAQSSHQARWQPWQEFIRVWLRPSGRWAGIALIVWVLIQSLFQPTLFLTGEISATTLTHMLISIGFDPADAAEQITEFQTARAASAYSVILREIIVVAINLFVVTSLVFEFTTHKAARLPIGLAAIGTALLFKSFMSVYLAGGDPLYWLTIGAQAGLLVGALAALVATGLRRRWRLALCAVACFCLLLIANLMPMSPFQSALSTTWRDGHMLTINGTLRHASVAWPWVMTILCSYFALRQSKK